jgi:hypothetical protein
VTLTAESGAPGPEGPTYGGAGGDDRVVAGPRPGLGRRVLRLPGFGRLPLLV